MKRPQYYNNIDSKKFYTRQEAESWAKTKKQAFKEQGISVKVTIDYGNDQMWVAKIIPKVD